MPEFSVSGLKDFDISADGHQTVLNLIGADNSIVSLRVDTLVLQTISQQAGFLLTKARQLAAANPNFVPALRPAKFRSDLIAGGQTVVVVFALASGLEHYYGLLPDEADALAHQMQDAAERGRKAAATKPARH
ncbi:MAG: hypothetical protein WAK63_10930 [Xanthobacteraceae bacterium]